jgi:hypothetical protein
VVLSFGELLPLKNGFRNSYPPELFLKPIAKYSLPEKAQVTSLQYCFATSNGIRL